MGDMRLTRNIMASLLALLLILLLFIPVWFISGVCRREEFIYSSARLVIGAAVRVLGVRTVVRGLDAVDLSRPPVIISNHLSNLDGPLLIRALPLNPRVLIKAQARRIPVIGWVMKLAGFVFVDRSSPSRRQEALEEAVARIQRRRCPFLVFPEGTRSRDGVTREFRKGGFLIARRAGVPLLPVRITGTNLLLPPGRRTCGAGTVFIDVFPLADPGGIAESELPGLIRSMQQNLYTDEKT
jgi:1-acyl-sn-glycerol-3-phosphate acyltransferase